VTTTDRPYVGPNGNERPGEHWNARLIREAAERKATESTGSPFPLAEGDKVLLTVDAEVYALPDEDEEDPDDRYYTLTVDLEGVGAQFVALTPDEVAQRVRKAGGR
jgi:hypothetical protein